MKYELNDWQPWIDIVIEDSGHNPQLIESFIEQTEKKYKTVVALAFSLAKWVYLSSDSGLHYIRGACGLCHLQDNRCDPCLVYYQCRQPKSLFELWMKCPSKENITKIVDYLFGLYKKEYNKLFG